MPRSAIFDLDGTLADTAADLIGAANALLQADGLRELDPKTARATAGRGGKALMSLGFETAGHPKTSAEIDALFPAYLKAYQTRIDAETRLFDGVIETLEELTKAGWALGVCTNKPEHLAIDLLPRLGRDRFFPVVIGADTLPVRKPDPRHVWETIDRLGAPRSRAVMIGDSVTDRDAARNAEIPVILVSFGYSVTPPASLKPDVLIDRYDQLIPALERLSPA